MADEATAVQEAPQAAEPAMVHPSQGVINEAPVVEPQEQEAEKTASPEPVAEAKPSEAPKEEAKAEAEKPKDDTPSSPAEKWAEEKKVIEKRLQDNAQWTNRVNQENAQLKQALTKQAEMLDILNKKFDGTWTEADEQARVQREQEANRIDPVQVATAAKLEGALVASREAANAIYGKETVDSLVFAGPDSPFMRILSDPIIRQVIHNSEAPIVEGIRILKQIEFEDKYGRTPTDIYASIEKEVEAKLKAKVEADFKKSLDKKAKLPEGIGGLETSQPPSGTTVWGPEQQMEFLRRTRAGSMHG